MSLLHQSDTLVAEDALGRAEQARSVLWVPAVPEGRGYRYVWRHIPVNTHGLMGSAFQFTPPAERLLSSKGPAGIKATL